MVSSTPCNKCRIKKIIYSDAYLVYTNQRGEIAWLLHMNRQQEKTFQQLQQTIHQTVQMLGNVEQSLQSINTLNQITQQMNQTQQKLQQGQFGQQGVNNQSQLQ